VKHPRQALLPDRACSADAYAMETYGED